MSPFLQIPLGPSRGTKKPRLHRTSQIHLTMISVTSSRSLYSARRLGAGVRIVYRHVLDDGDVDELEILVEV